MVIPNDDNVSTIVSSQHPIFNPICYIPIMPLSQYPRLKIMRSLLQRQYLLVEIKLLGIRHRVRMNLVLQRWNEPIQIVSKPFGNQ